MQLTLSKLKKKAQKYGVTPQELTGPGGRETRRDWIKALGQYYLRKKYPKDNIPWGLKKRLEIQSPMKAYRFTDLKVSEQEKIFSSEKWGIEKNIDGLRMILYFDPKGRFSAFSRDVSVKDFLPLEYTNKLVIPKFPEALENRSLILDTQVICQDSDIIALLQAKGIIAINQKQSVTAVLSFNQDRCLRIQKQLPLDFYILDVLHYSDKDLFHLQYSQRRKLLVDLLPHFELSGYQFKLVELIFENKMDYVKTLLKLGYGAIAKHTESEYTANESRGRKRWVKIKRSMSKTVHRIGRQTINGSIVGYALGKDGTAWKNLVSILEILVTVTDKQGVKNNHIVKVTNIPLDLRREITTIDSEIGRPILKPRFYGRLIEIDSQAIHKKDKKHNYAKFISLKPEPL